MANNRRGENEKKCLRNLEQWTWMETDYGKIIDLHYLHGFFLLELRRIERPWRGRKKKTYKMANEDGDRVRGINP